MPQGYRKDGSKLGFQKGHPKPKGAYTFQKGHKFGFKKGHIPWIKGKHIFCGGGVQKGQFAGSKNPMWKKGRIKDSFGYILIYKPEHPFCSKQKYVPEHRLIAEKQIGRYLKPKEVVHHRGIKYPLGSIENKQDNRIENLMVFKNGRYHFWFHKNGFCNLKGIIFDGRLL